MRHTRPTGRRGVLALVTGCAFALVAGVTSPSASALPTPAADAAVKTQAVAAPGYLSTDGAQIVDSAGEPVRLTGLNWFGAETDVQAPHGLWSRGYKPILDQMSELGYNTLRMPYSNDILAPGAEVNGIDYSQNADLEGLSPLEVMDTVIDYAGTQGMSVILDRHRPNSSSQSELWYTDEVPETTWISDWETLAERYEGNTTVVGADLHNEPHGSACWGCGDEKLDWRLAAERAGSAIQAVNPDWLIIVEGVDSVEGFETQGWWGGNLSAAGEFPVRLPVEDKLVYSAHDYANSVNRQPWINDDPTFPENLPGFWDKQWGYLKTQDIAPVLLGEFGSTLSDPKDVVWMKSLLAYLGTGVTGTSFTYWSLNPNSGDTGGILADDWTTVEQQKQDILEPYLQGASAPGAPAPEPEPTDPTPAPPAPSDPTPAPPAGAGTCTAAVEVTSEWPGGYQAMMTINHDTPTKDPWSVTFALPGASTFGNGWNADMTADGSTVTATAPAWNSTVAAGTLVSIMFNATGSADAIDDISLDGTACAAG